tara:strand:- start:670 stop:831 length:162 start_codon:yes stop_codon:yes gene_type:complete
MDYLTDVGKLLMIIVEVGSIHGSDVDKALALITCSSSSEADFIKFQMSIAENE